MDLTSHLTAFQSLPRSEIDLRIAAFDFAAEPKMLLDPSSDRIVDVMVDVGNPVHEPDDLALQRGRLGSASRMRDDPVADRIGEVEPLTIALQDVHDP